MLHLWNNARNMPDCRFIRADKTKMEEREMDKGKTDEAERRRQRHDCLQTVSESTEER